MAGRATLEDTRSPEDKAMLAHLASFNPPEESDEIQSERDEVPEINLPKDVKKVHALMQETLRTEPKDARENRLKNLKLAAIRAHLFELEQGPKQPAFGPKEHTALAANQNASAKLLRLEALARNNPDVREVLDELKQLKAAKEAAAEETEKP